MSLNLAAAIQLLLVRLYYEGETFTILGSTSSLVTREYYYNLCSEHIYIFLVSFSEFQNLR